MAARSNDMSLRTLDSLLSPVKRRRISDHKLIHIFAHVMAEMRKRGIVRTKNIVGDLAEGYAVEFAKTSQRVRGLTLLKTNNPDCDAIDGRKRRYSIKGASLKTNKTSAFRLPKGSVRQMKRPPFDFVLIVRLDDLLQPFEIVRFTWKQFFEAKRWEETWKAHSLPLTRALLDEAEIIFEARGAKK